MPKSPTAAQIQRAVEARDRRMGIAREMVKVEQEVADVESFLAFDRAAQRAFRGIMPRPTRRAMMLGCSKVRAALLTSLPATAARVGPLCCCR
jgi:hypothetical protein